MGVVDVKFVSTILNSIDMVMKSHIANQELGSSERVHWKATAWGPGSRLLQVQAEPRAVQSRSARLGLARASSVTTHGLPHYEYLIRRTGMFTFTFLLIVLWLTHTDLPIPFTLCPIVVITLYPVTICVPPSAQLPYSLCPLP